MRVLPLLLLLLAATSLAAFYPAPAARADDGPTVRFQKQQLDTEFRGEGVAVADLNRDGQLDIASGGLWYAAPEWKPQPLVAEVQAFDPKKYSNCFNCFADDLNGDGWSDLVQITWPGKAAIWLENPQGKAGPWKQHVVTPVANNESPQFVDIDGDGQRELVAAVSPDPEKPDGPQRKMAILKRTGDAAQPWSIRTISAAEAPGTKRYAHGLGVGDVNGDGRHDVVTAAGWWEAPASPADGAWKFHAASFGEKGQRAADIHVHDFDGDGDADVLATSPHAFGIWWHEQLPDGKWQTHEIDKSFSQTHSVCLADINGDGLADFVTGKRYWAHGGRDAGGDGPAVMFWYEQRRDGRKVEWIAHQFDHDSGVGTQFVVADVDADGLLDVVTSNKKGVFYFRQVR